MTDALKPLPWQEELWLRMTTQVIQQRLPHALLFIGPRGVGKRHFAYALTAFLLCENRSGYACGNCRSCVQLAAGNHPNSIILQRRADEKTGKLKRDIAIDQVRELGESLALSSHYGQSRVALIDPADALNHNGVNALLKTIEEPPAGAFLILISERSQALPATLRSRCQRLRFTPPAHQISMNWLDTEPSAAADALEQAQGAPLRAREMLDAGLIARGRNWATEMSAIAAGKRDPLTTAAEIGKDTAAEFLEWLLIWLTSRLREQVLQPAASLHARLEPLMRETLEARARLTLNGPPQLVLESVLILWWRLNRTKSA